MHLERISESSPSKNFISKSSSTNYSWTVTVHGPCGKTLKYVKMIPLDVKTVPQVIICNTDVTTGILSGTYIKLLKFRITQFLDFELLIFKKPPNTKKSCRQKHFFFSNQPNFKIYVAGFRKIFSKNVLKYESKTLVRNFFNCLQATAWKQLFKMGDF